MLSLGRNTTHSRCLPPSQGSKSIEVRPVGVSKGDSVKRMLALIAESDIETMGQSSLPSVDFVLVAGEAPSRGLGLGSPWGQGAGCCLSSTIKRMGSRSCRQLFARLMAWY